MHYILFLMKKTSLAIIAKLQLHWSFKTIQCRVAHNLPSCEMQIRISFYNLRLEASLVCVHILNHSHAIISLAAL